VRALLRWLQDLVCGTRVIRATEAHLNAEWERSVDARGHWGGLHKRKTFMLFKEMEEVRQHRI
jgi:hypothetical protein